MIEKLIFNLLAFTLFFLNFLNLIRRNDSNYIYILIMQAIGIAINFIELMFGIELSASIKVLIYLLSIVIPLVLLIIEYKKDISITELFYLLKAEIFAQNKQNQQAEKDLQTIIKKYPNNPMAHKRLAELYEKQNLLEDAIREYEISMDRHYEEKTYLKIGSLYEQIGRNEHAKTIYESIVKENPKNYEASMSLGNVLYNMNEFKSAIQIYQTLLNYYPTDYQIYFSLGMTYTMINDFQKAKENYQMAAEINSLAYHAKYALGILNMIFEELEEAEKYFEECLDSEEVDAKAYFYLARISIIRGEQEKAISYANIAIEIDQTLYEKIQKDTIFITILDRIKKPNNAEGIEHRKIERNPKEQQVEEHLEKMTKIVGKLKNDDIQMIENVMKSRNEETNTKEVKEQEKEEKEKSNGL